MTHKNLLCLVMVALAGCGGAAKPEAASAPAAPERSETPAASAEAATELEGDDGAALTDESSPDTGDAVDVDKAQTEFRRIDAKEAKAVRGEHASQIKATASEAAVKLYVIDKDKGPIEGVVVLFTAPDGTKRFTAETDAAGYTELLLPIGQQYEAVYLSLGRKEIAAKVDVPNQPELNLNLTLRYKRRDPEGGTKDGGRPRFVLAGVEFETGKATLRPESHERLALVVDYMTHKKSARLEISGHTDNVGNPKANKALSQKRAESVKKYLVSKGVQAARIEAVGHGDAMPIAPNDTEEGRQKNRRIEATEL